VRPADLRTRTLRPVLWLAGVVLLCVAAQAQPLIPVEDTDRPTVLDEQQQQQRRENTFTAGVLLLIGVVIIGLLLIAAAVVWGAKVRRLARREDSPSGRQDEFWYLRKTPPSSEPKDQPSAPLDDQNGLS
jgi:hypothetical protein